MRREVREPIVPNLMHEHGMIRADIAMNTFQRSQNPIVPFFGLKRREGVGLAPPKVGTGEDAGFLGAGWVAILGVVGWVPTLLDVHIRVARAAIDSVVRFP